MSRFSVSPEAHEKIRSDDSVSAADLMSQEAKDAVSGEDGAPKAGEPKEEGDASQARSELGEAKPKGETPSAEEKPEGGEKPSDDGDKSDDKVTASDDSGNETTELSVEELETYSAYYQEFTEKGELSEETQEKVLADGNIFSKTVPMPVRKAFLAQLVAGLTAMQNQATQEAHSLVGGKETFDSMLAWAAKNLPSDEILQFNSQVDSADTVKAAIKGLHARYVLATGGDASGSQDGGKGKEEPSLAHEGAAAASGAAPIRSRAEWKAIVRDPRYAKDESFRSAAQARLAASMKSGAYQR